LTSKTELSAELVASDNGQMSTSAENNDYCLLNNIFTLFNIISFDIHAPMRRRWIVRAHAKFYGALYIFFRVGLIICWKSQYSWEILQKQIAKLKICLILWQRFYCPYLFGIMQMLQYNDDNNISFLYFIFWFRYILYYYCKIIFRILRTSHFYNNANEYRYRY